MSGRSNRRKPRSERALRPGEVIAIARYDGCSDEVLRTREKELRDRITTATRELHVVKLARRELAKQKNPVALLAEALRKEGHELDAPSFERARLELDRQD